MKEYSIHLSAKFAALSIYFLLLTEKLPNRSDLCRTYYNKWVGRQYVPEMLFPISTADWRACLCSISPGAAHVLRNQELYLF